MKKTLAAACLAFVACIPVFARSEQSVTTPALDSLNRDQLIGVIKCLSDQKGDTGQTRINKCINSVAGQVTITSHLAGDNLRPGQMYKISWRGNNGEPYRVSIIRLPATSSETTNVIPVGQTKSGQSTFDFYVPKDLKDGRYQIQLVNRYNVESRSGVFTIEAKTQFKGAIIVVPPAAGMPNVPSKQQSGTTSVVYNLDLAATGTAQTVSSIDLEVSVAQNSNVIPGATNVLVRENPAALIKRIILKEGNTVLLNIPVNTMSTFTRDANNDYYARLSGLNIPIQAGYGKKLQVYFETNVVDIDRIVSIDGYQAKSITATNPAGLVGYYSFDGDAFRKTIEFSGKPVVIPVENTYALCTDGVDNDYDMTIDMADSDCTPFVVTPAVLVVATTTSPLTGRNIVVSPTLGSQNNPVFRFSAKSTNASSTIKSVKFAVSGLVPKTMSLSNDSSKVLYSTVSPASYIVEFKDLAIPVGKDLSQYLIVKADFAPNTIPGSPITVSLTEVTYNNGVTDTVNKTVIGGNRYTMYPAAPNIIFVDSPILDQYNTSTTSALSAKFNMQIEAKGASFAAPVISDFRIGLSKNGFVSYLDKNSVYQPYISVSTTPNQPIADGSISNVEVRVFTGFPKQTTLNNYQMFIDAFYWGGQNGTTTQIWGLEALRTPVVTL